MCAYHYDDPNVLRPEQNFSQGAEEKSVAIRCPHCRRLGSAHKVGQGVSYMKAITRDGRAQTAGMSASIHRCPNPPCGGLVLIVRNGTTNDHVIFPPELIDFDTKGVPQRCERTISEAVACLGAGAPRAATMMVRRLLEEICEESGVEGNTLHERLAALEEHIVLPKTFLDAMDELKLLGNDAAHVKARDYDDIGPEEAAIAIELTKEIVKGLYQLENLVGRLKARKNHKG